MTNPALDYLTYRIDVLNEQAKDMASGVYERAQGVSLRELRVLRLAYHSPGITQSEVVTLSRFEKTLVSRIISALVRRGLLVREVGVPDARWIHLFPTEEGKAACRHCNRLAKKMEQAMYSALSESELAVFERCLQKLTAKVEADAESAQQLFG